MSTEGEKITIINTTVVTSVVSFCPSPLYPTRPLDLLKRYHAGIKDYMQSAIMFELIAKFAGGGQPANSACRYNAKLVREQQKLSHCMGQSPALFVRVQIHRRGGGRERGEDGRRNGARNTTPAKKPFPLAAVASQIPRSKNDKEYITKCGETRRMKRNDGPRLKIGPRLVGLLGKRTPNDLGVFKVFWPYLLGIALICPSPHRLSPRPG